MSLRNKTARWIFDARWSQMPDDEVAVHINNTILDAVCEQVNNVGLSTDDEKATIQAINKMRDEK